MWDGFKNTATLSSKAIAYMFIFLPNLIILPFNVLLFVPHKFVQNYLAQKSAHGELDPVLLQARHVP